MRNIKRVLAAVASGGLLVGTSPAALAEDAPAAGGETTYNGPESCVTIGPDGKVQAPGPGDCAQFGKEGQGRTDAQARNVILIIGDGMDQQSITAARNYLHGAAGRFEGLDNLPATGAYTHHSFDQDGTVNYVTDSAASATAWATGTKTYNGAIGVDLEGKPQENIVEMAKKAGMRTGNVTTSEIQDATPAAIGSHALNRKCYGPDAGEHKDCAGGEYKKQYRENGGLGSISEQLVDTRADVTLGGGMESFQEKVLADGKGNNPFMDTSTTWTKGKSVLDNAKDNGFQVVTNAQELSAVKEANQDKPLLGLFHDGNMTTRFERSKPQMNAGTTAPQECKPQDTGEEPELKDMTTKAIELLDDPDADKGFFLQVESASIDKANHKSDACGMIGEVERIDEAIAAALDFAKKDGNTMVVVTADHSHSAQILEDPAESVSPTTRLKTKDGIGELIGYGTLTADEILKDPEASTQHSGSQLRVAAFGPGAENVIGQLDQSDVHYVMANALGLGDWEVAKEPRYPKIDLSKGREARTDVPDTCYLVTAGGGAPQPGDCAQFGKEGQGLSTEKAKNVVLMISDGTGDSEITSARNYLYGANGRLPGADEFDFTGNITTYSLAKDNALPDLVTDSAASGTGWNSGTKTYNGGLGIDVAGKPVPTLGELAKAKGMKTGNITTAELQDATPAAFAVHSLNRKCYGPEEEENGSSCQGAEFESQYRENGGLGSISEQLVDLRADLTLGGGKEAFDQKVKKGGNWSGNTWTEGKSVWDNAADQGYQLVTTADELDKIQEADSDKPVLGVFADGNFPRNYAQSIPETDGAVAPAMTCEPNSERPSEIPSLAAMTTKGLDLLQNNKGFIMQVEAASVDKAGHDADACGQFGEFEEYDAALKAVRDWVEKTGEPTLIVSTADHAHTSQITANGKNTAGRTTKVVTPGDGAEMTINYATAPSNDDDIALGGQTHTGAQIRVAASGPGAENIVGQLDQTDIFYVVANAAQLDTNPDAVNLEPRWDAEPRFPESGGGMSAAVWWIIGGVALLVIVGAAAFFTTRNRENGVATAEATAPEKSE